MPSDICPHFGVCGGCSHWDKPYLDQLRLKEEALRQALDGIPVGEFRPIRGSPETTFYRNKMEFSFGDEWDREILHLEKTGPGAHLGLHPKRRFGVTLPTPRCRLLSEESRLIMSVAARWATLTKNPVYVRAKNEGVLRHLVIREGKNTGERMVNLVATSGVKHLDQLARMLQNLEVPITTLLWTRHDGLSDVVRGQSETVFWGEGSIRERVGGVTVQVRPHTFMQTNTHAAEKMLELLREWAGVGDTLWDLYCGTGVIGLNLAGQFIHVRGMESEGESVESARFTARDNLISNFTVTPGRVEECLSELRIPRGRTDVVIVDPPRTGLESSVIQVLQTVEVPNLLYVSCNPKTLARDLARLLSAYQIDSVQPMDFFPHTDHVETVVRLRIR